MDNAAHSPTDQEKSFVLWGYVLQWATLILPPVIAASLIYLLFVRKRVFNDWLVSHIRWQLATCIIIAAAIPVAFGLLFTGFAGVSSDAPVSILATFLLVGAAFVFPFWLIYRFAWGTISYVREKPMRPNPYI